MQQRLVERNKNQLFCIFDISGKSNFLSKNIKQLTQKSYAMFLIKRWFQWEF